MSFFTNVDSRYEQLSSHINIVESVKLRDCVVVVYMTFPLTLGSFRRRRVTGQEYGTFSEEVSTQSCSVRFQGLMHVDART